ncbi:MAG: transglycosylase SLT domain-containing protein [Synechococcaceae cyanobacterium]
MPRSPVLQRLLPAALAPLLLTAGCAPALRAIDDLPPASEPTSDPATSTPARTPAPGLLPSAAGLATAPDGRHYPLVPQDPAALASLLAAVEAAVRDPATPEAELPRLGHQQQVIYRVLAWQPPQAAAVRAALPARWQPVFDRQVGARREFLAMHAGHRRPERLPAWRVIQPLPAERLLELYRSAGAATGIPWEVLAAINLVETGMGRIDGISVADARGPMQFLPSTWAEPGIGNGGDIRNPADAIPAAARYLVRRGGPANLQKAIWGYNNSNHYVRAVLGYAALIKEDPAAFRGLYHWEIHFAAAGGDLWLPVGYEQRQPIAVAAYRQRAPFSVPPPGSSGY